MNFRPFLSAVALTVPFLAQAHISYSTRDLGTFDGVSTTTGSIANQGIAGNFGWADAADADFGDSHKARWYRFTLTQDSNVTLTALATSFSVTSGTACGSGAASSSPKTCALGLLPGFSVYAGLLPAAAYDTAPSTAAYLATSFPDGAGGTAKEGAWNALGDTVLGNDAGVLGTVVYQGHAYDGQMAGVTGGDGLADGRVSQTFRLAAGTYSVALGGSDGTAQNSSPVPYLGASLAVQVQAVPEPEAILLAALGAGVAVFVRRRSR
jgi:PEP-CTERM motif